MGGRTQMNIITERLIIRDMQMDDLESIHRYASDFDHVKYMTWGPNTYEETRHFLVDAIDKNGKVPRKNYDLAITNKKDSNMIGGIGIYLNDEMDQAMIGWILHKDFWNQGYVTEAANALMDYAFNQLGLRRIYATCDAENIASFRVMEKLGMRKEAHFVLSRMFRKEMGYRDELHYAILKSEYVNR
jgi:[ribosomal protein S5]-alanine N-acetyltransferase